MINRVFLFRFLLISLFASNALAGGTASSTKISQIYCGYYGGANMCSIYFGAAISNAPNCHTIGRNRMQVSTEDDTGKALLSLALVAYTSEKIVDIGGKGDCTVWADTEDLNHITIK